MARDSESPDRQVEPRHCPVAAPGIAAEELCIGPAPLVDLARAVPWAQRSAERVRHEAHFRVDSRLPTKQERTKQRLPQLLPRIASASHSVPPSSFPYPISFRP
jgi:hypothetical protein